MTPEDCLRCSRSEHEIAVSTNRLQRPYGEKPIQCLQRKTALSPHTLIPYTLAVTLRLQVSILNPKPLALRPLSPEAQVLNLKP